MVIVNCKYFDVYLLTSSSTQWNKNGVGIVLQEGRKQGGTLHETMLNKKFYSKVCVCCIVPDYIVLEIIKHWTLAVEFMIRSIIDGQYCYYIHFRLKLLSDTK